MVFTPVERPSNRNDREIVRETVIPAILLREIAELFPRLPPREPETKFERQLAAVLGMDPRPAFKATRPRSASGSSVDDRSRRHRPLVDRG
jgi:hypothetical protein